ncbi:histidine-rich glycoprotein-like [Bacillus rossius redtenbacheri]|uniref:histidine-rich glycoprotein-like n=1 Tax=Bacillus rossius redtenbacheri TaxID=93214 RepID=UPI002FDE95A4
MGHHSTAGNPLACLVLMAVALLVVRGAEGLAVRRQEGDHLPVAKPASYSYATTDDQGLAPRSQRNSRRPPHATHHAEEAKVATHQTAIHHGGAAGRRRLETYPSHQKAGPNHRRSQVSRYERPQISESQTVERKETTHRRPAYADTPLERTEKKSAKYSRTSYDEPRVSKPRRKAGARKHNFADDEPASFPSHHEVRKTPVPQEHYEETPRSLPSHRVEHKAPVEHAPSYEEVEEQDEGAQHHSSHVVEHKVLAVPEEDHYHTSSEAVKSPSPFKARHAEDQKPSASGDHKKGHHGHHNEKHEEGGGHKHHADHHDEKGHKGHKGYKGYHGHEEGEKGHHDKEHHKKHYEEDGGEKHKHHHEDGHYGEHHHEEEGKKGAKYGEEGEHKKGHSTKGEHNVHKKDEYEKKHEFYDEHHEGGDHEKHGEYSGEHEHHEGGHEKKGHRHGEHHEEHHGKKGHHEKGHHEHDHKGHKEHKGHEEHHDHHEEHSKKGGDEDGKKWGYKKSDKGKRR